MKQLMFASMNEAKINELKKYLPECQILSLLDFADSEDVDETGLSYRENAFLKANAFYQKHKFPVVADDSGIEAHYLFGTKYGSDMAVPGIYSARYASNHDVNLNNQELLKQLENTPFDLNDLTSCGTRSCHYVSALCYIDENGKEHYFEGELFGVFGDKAKGTNGWAYDLFFHPILDGKVSKKTYAELEDSVRNEISHRAIALNKLKDFIDNH